MRPGHDHGRRAMIAATIRMRNRANMTHIVVEREIGGRLFRIETGKVARQASGAVIATYGDCAVLGSAM